MSLWTTMAMMRRKMEIAVVTTVKTAMTVKTTTVKTTTGATIKGGHINNRKTIVVTQPTVILRISTMANTANTILMLRNMIFGRNEIDRHHLKI
jgi:hypothetical protein